MHTTIHPCWWGHQQGLKMPLSVSPPTTFSQVYSSMLLMLPQAALAQDLGELTGTFVQEKTQLGQRVDYLLVYRHDPAVEFRFPDKAYDFTPFELLEAHPSPTVTEGGISVDSIRYTLATYELGSPQSLAVPVIYVDAEGQEQLFFPEADALRLEEVVLQVPDSLRFFESTTPMIVDKTFNFYYWGFALAGVGGILLAAVLLFGKRIGKALTVMQLKKRHRKFLEQFEYMEQQALGDASQLLALMGLWKGYTGKLVGFPLPSLTTKEIATYMQQPNMLAALRRLDRAVYGHAQATVERELAILKDTANHVFDQKLKEVQHG